MKTRAVVAMLRMCPVVAVLAAIPLLAGVATAQQQKPNILFIMGDDIGWMQPSIYHRGLMVGETPNIDRIGREGAMFVDYVAMQSCTSGRNAFFTGMYPLRTGMIPPQLPGSPSYLRPGTPALAWFLRDLGYTTGEFGKNHLGDHTEALPTAHGFQEYWGYLYHLDAMQQVSFPDINKSPTDQGVAPPCKNTPIPGVPEPPSVDPKTTVCLTPPRPVLWCKSSDGTAANQTCKDEGPLTLERSKTVDEEISAKVIDFLDRNDPKKTNKPLQATPAASLQPPVLAVPCAAVQRPAGVPPGAAPASSPGMRWSATRSLEPGVPAGTISHGRRPAACGLQSWSAAAAPAQQGVSLHLRRPEDAFPTGLWHNSV
jgi:Sulfatase